MSVDNSGELEAMELAGLLIVYGNWRNRFIRARPRHVHLSCELRGELTATPHANAVSELRRKIEAGEDLSAHLSKATKVAYVPQALRGAKDGRARHLDAMLSEHGLHHLHLGPHRGGKFVARTPDLLFGAFHEDDAYLVGLFPHGAWARRDVLERIVRNWPQARILYRSKTATGLTHDFSDADRLDLMMAGISAPIRIGGRVLRRLGRRRPGLPSRSRCA